MSNRRVDHTPTGEVHEGRYDARWCSRPASASRAAPALAGAAPPPAGDPRRLVQGALASVHWRERAAISGTRRPGRGRARGHRAARGRRLGSRSPPLLGGRTAASPLKLAMQSPANLRVSVQAADGTALPGDRRFVGVARRVSLRVSAGAAREHLRPPVPRQRRVVVPAKRASRWRSRGRSNGGRFRKIAGATVRAGRVTDHLHAPRGRPLALPPGGRRPRPGGTRAAAALSHGARRVPGQQAPRPRLGPPLPGAGDQRDDLYYYQHGKLRRALPGGLRQALHADAGGPLRRLLQDGRPELRLRPAGALVPPRLRDPRHQPGVPAERSRRATTRTAARGTTTRTSSGCGRACRWAPRCSTWAELRPRPGPRARAGVLPSAGCGCGPSPSPGPRSWPPPRPAGAAAAWGPPVRVSAHDGAAYLAATPALDDGPAADGGLDPASGGRQRERRPGAGGGAPLPGGAAWSRAAGPVGPRRDAPGRGGRRRAGAGVVAWVRGRRLEGAQRGAGRRALAPGGHRHAARGGHRPHRRGRPVGRGHRGLERAPRRRLPGARGRPPGAGRVVGRARRRA